MLVSGTIGNTTYLKSDIQNDIQNPIVSPTQVVVTGPATTTLPEVVAPKTVSSSKSDQKVNTNVGVEEAVREYFADIPLMVEVSKCESRYRQFEKNGLVFRGKVNANDVGALQINETYHLKRAKKLGYDVYSLNGNMAYARLLYKEQGAQPWASSYPCWGKSPLAANFTPRSRASIVTIPSAPVLATVSVSDDAATTSVKVAPELNALTSQLPVSNQVALSAPAIGTDVSVLAER